MSKKTHLDLDEVFRHLKAKTKSKTSQKSRDVLERDRAELAWHVHLELTKHMDALYHRGDGSYLERLAELDRGQFDADDELPKLDTSAWDEMKNKNAVSKIFDEMLRDGFEPTVKESAEGLMPLMNYCHCLWLYYTFISPKIPPGIVTEKLSLAFAKVIRLATIAMVSADKRGRALPGIEARQTGKRAAVDKRMKAVLKTFDELGDVSEKSKNKIAQDVREILPKGDKCDVKTILEHLKKGGKI